MKIEMTTDQFRQLMKLVYLGKWMATSHHEITDESISDIEQVLLLQAKKYGLDDMIAFDSEENKYHPSDQMEEEMEPLIQLYDDFTFWDELAWQMAERDFARKFDQAQLLCMTADEIFREKNTLADKYFDEFSENGVENFGVLKKI
jgi:hypothetical protein